MSGPLAAGIFDTVRKREQLLSCLSEGVEDKRKIETEVGVSRSTVNRALRELEESGILRDDHASFDLTLYGRLAYEQYRILEETYGHLATAKELFTHLPADTEIDIGILQDAEINLADRQAPIASFEQIRETVRSAASVCGHFPIIHPSYFECFHEQVVNHGLDAEFILNRQLVSTLAATYHEELISVATADNCDLRQTEGGPTFGVVLVDQKEVWVCVYRDVGSLLGTLVNDTNAAVDWARNVLNQCRGNGHVITAEGDISVELSN